MNNDNNNLNGQVLGSVDNSNNLSNNTNEIDSLETLDISNNQSTSFMHTSNVIEENSQVLDGPTVMQTPNQSNVINTQPTSPEPAYTNPQTINSTPGFESTAIGTTPPISLEPEQQPKNKKGNKTIFVVIVIVLLFGVGFGTYYVLNYTDLLSNKAKIEIETKNIEVNVGDTLSTNITNYANISGTDVRNCLLDTKDVDVKKEGTYTYKITCGDIYKNGKVTVIDNRELEIKTEKVYKVKGEALDVKEFIVNPNSTYNYEIVNKEEINNYLNSNVGNYQVKIKVTSGTKVKEVEETLVILEHKIVGYLTCTSKEQNVSNSSAKKTIKEKFAIAGDGKFSFGKVANEIYEFKFTDETEYSNYLAKYKADNTIVIDNVTGKVEFDNSNLIITITNELSDTELNSRYGENTIVNYSSIKKYFIDTLGYECPYKKIETQN